MTKWMFLGGGSLLSIAMFNIIPFCIGLILFMVDWYSQRDVERKSEAAVGMGRNPNRWWYNIGMAILTIVLFTLLVLSAGLTMLGEENMIKISNQIAR